MKEAWTELIQTRFSAAYPSGFPIPVITDLVTYEYKWAAAVHPPAPPVEIGNYLVRTAIWAPLVALWNASTKELKRSLSATTTQAQYEVLPAELRRKRVHPDQELFDQWFTSRAGEDDYFASNFSDLALFRRLLASGGKFKVSEVKALAITMEHVGLSLEPDPRIANSAFTPDTRVIVYRPEFPGTVDVVAYRSYRLVVEAAVCVAAADGDLDDATWDRFFNQVDQTAQCPPETAERLKMYARLLVADGERGIPSKARFARLSEEQRSGLASLVISLALADGKVTENEEIALTKVYKALGISIKTLDQLIRPADPSANAAVATDAAASEPAEPAMVIDWAAVSALQAQTASVQSLLHQHLADEDTEEAASEPDVIAAATGQEQVDQVAPALVTAHLSEGEVLAGDPGLLRQSALPAGLPAAEEAFLAHLPRTSPLAWDDVVRIGQAQGVNFPRAAVDRINEWADDVFGDVLLEGDGPLIFHHHLLPAVAP
jgi:uncharacterized tellurite resistance protein B-like protein